MRRTSMILASSGSVAALAAGLVAAPAGAADSGPQAVAGTQVPVYAGPLGGTPSLVQEPATSNRAPGAKFVVSYSGFSAPAKAAFQRAVNMWAGKLNTSVPITVRASWEPLGSGILGSAGPSYVWNLNGVLYVDAVANKKQGRQLNAAPDIVARFSSNFSNWHFGTGPAPAGKYDFTSVVAHELGHGLGFLGAGRVSGNAGTVRLSGKNISYDRFTKLGPNAASPLLWKMPDMSTQLGSALRSNNVYFDSPAVRRANGGKAAKLYAPAAWRQGSSYSHLDEATFPKGNPNSLMTYAIGGGETIRTPGPVGLALLKGVGW